MADIQVSREGGLADRFRKAIAATALLVYPNGDDRTRIASTPTITSGTGAPAGSSPNGSIYLRTNGLNGDESLYMRIGGVWVALQGQTT